MAISVSHAMKCRGEGQGGLTNVHIDSKESRHDEEETSETDEDGVVSWKRLIQRTTGCIQPREEEDHPSKENIFLRLKDQS